MKKQYVQSLVAGLSLLSAIGSYAQEGNQLRPIDKQVITAKSLGLFQHTVSPSNYGKALLQEAQPTRL